MAQGKPQSSARKRGRQPARVSVGGSHAQTYVEEVAQSLTVPHEMDGLYVDDLPAPNAQNGSAKNGSAKNGAPSAGTGGAGAKAESSDERKKRKAKRAAERRRARGDAPEQVDGTNTALQQRRAPEGGMSGQLNFAAGVLTCVKGPEEGLALNLLEGTYTIGRGRDNSFVLKDIAASRKHVCIEVVSNKVTVSDMGSGNGTRVNGKRIDKAVLKNGDRVELGNSVLVFTYLGNDKSHLSLPPTTGDTMAKEAQQRIVAAAERLAAELSERLRAEDDLDEGPPTAYSRGKSRSSDAPHSRIDSGIDEVLTASANREHRERSPVPMPEQLWNDAETKVPLSEVVPIDRPLAAVENTSTLAPQGPSLSSATSRPTAPAPPPRPQYPPQKREPVLRELSPVGPAMVPQGVAAEPPARSSWAVGVLLAFVVMIALGGAVFAGYWSFLRDDRAARLADDDGAASTFAKLTARATEALAKSDYAAALAFAAEAQKLKPDDAAANALLVAIRTAKAEAESRAERDADATPPAGDDKRDPGSNDDVVNAAPEPKAPEPEPVEAKREEPRPVEATKAEAKKAPEPTVSRRNDERQRTASKPRPRPRPKPRPARRGERRAPEPKGMSDAEAKSVYIEAMRAVRGDDEQRGCALIRKVAKEAPGDSNWRTKARNALGRYGCE